MSKTTRYNKPVNKITFWKNRIDTAQKEHYSVYVTGHEDWKMINEAHKKIIEKEVEGTVLDLGCGYGRLSELFPSNYTGVDFSPDFIRRAQEKYPKVSFIVADLKNLPFEDSSVDWGICVSIKRMIIDNLGEKEWELMLKEAERVCKNVLILEYETPWDYEMIKVGYPEYKTYDR